MKVILERFENESAIIELDIGKIITVPKILFSEFKEGDVIFIKKDTNETNKRKKQIENQMKNLFE